MKPGQALCQRHPASGWAPSEGREPEHHLVSNCCYMLMVPWWPPESHAASKSARHAQRLLGDDEPSVEFLRKAEHTSISVPVSPAGCVQGVCPSLAEGNLLPLVKQVLFGRSTLGHPMFMPGEVSRNLKVRSLEENPQAPDTEIFNQN